MNADFSSELQKPEYSTFEEDLFNKLKSKGIAEVATPPGRLKDSNGLLARSVSTLSDDSLRSADSPLKQSNGSILSHTDHVKETLRTHGKKAKDSPRLEFYMKVLFSESKHLPTKPLPLPSKSEPVLTVPSNYVRSSSLAPTGAEHKSILVRHSSCSTLFVDSTMHRPNLKTLLKRHVHQSLSPRFLLTVI